MSAAPHLLAVSYVLPPMLYPQAIQIGRLLYHTAASGHAGVTALAGTVEEMASGLDCYADLDQHLRQRLVVPYRTRLRGLPLRVAQRFVPFYGRIPDEFRGWVAPAAAAVEHQFAAAADRPQVLATFGEPMTCHLLGLRLKRTLGLPWLAHFSDPWADNPFRRAFFLSQLVNRRLEAQVVAAADTVVFTSQETLERVMGKYPAAWQAKAQVLPHGYDPALYAVPTAVPPLSASAPLRLRYLGNFYGHRTPYPLFEALLALHRQDPAALADVRVELVGGVPGYMLLHPAYRALPPGLVTVVPTVTYSESLRRMAEADLLLVIDAPDELSVFLPSKLIDYLGAGTPVLGIVPPGTSARLLERLGGGSAVADPRDISAVTAALAASLATARARRQQGGIPAPWGQADLRQSFQIDRVAARFAELLHTTIDRAGGR